MLFGLLWAFDGGFIGSWLLSNFLFVEYKIGEIFEGNLMDFFHEFLSVVDSCRDGDKGVDIPFGGS